MPITTGNTISNAITSGPDGNIWFSEYFPNKIGELVLQTGTTTAVTASINPSLLNQSVTFTASVSPQVGSGTPTGTVQFVVDAVNLGGPLTLTGGSASISTASLSLGPHTITATYSGDSNFLGSTGSLTQNVQYTFSGFRPPLSQNIAFGLNRTIPIKWQLSDANGNLITILSAVSSLQIQALDANGHPVGAPFNPTPTGGTGLRNYGSQYIFNWQTKGLAAGSYEILLTLADGTIKTKVIQLAANGTGGALLVDGTNSTTTAIGALLGGDIDLYVDNTNRNLTADDLARVQDAVTAVDAVTDPYGVAVAEVTDPTQADVTLNMNLTSAVGGYTDGVLGCTTDAGQITIIAGWNFYAGSDSTQIGSAQFDFETIVIHEIGHALGLGHSANNASVMFATLDAGMANRALAVADLNVPDSGTGGACGLHADQAPGTGFSFDSFYPPLQPSLPRGEGESWEQPVNGQQAALNAVLADWNSTMDFASQAAHILDDGQNSNLLHRASLRAIDVHDDFWPCIGGTVTLDKVGDLTLDFGRNLYDRV
jgi:Bacterial Ig-like domain (group 3)/Matrixin